MKKIIINWLRIVFNFHYCKALEKKIGNYRKVLIMKQNSNLTREFLYTEGNWPEDFAF